MTRFFVTHFFILTVIALVAFPALAQEVSSNDSKLELAKQVHEYRPVRPQVDAAIDRFAQTQAPAQREAFKTAMHSVLNIKAIEKTSIEAYADIFTEKELKAMAEYYAKPEAQSAAKKSNDYAARVYPEIIRMLDKAAMRVRTGGQ